MISVALVTPIVAMAALASSVLPAIVICAGNSSGNDGAVSQSVRVASVPQILFANLMTASALLNALWLHLCGALHYSELVFDIAEGLMQPLALPGPS